MRARTLRFAALGMVILSAFALTGCYRVFRATLGGPDPPVHYPFSAGHVAATGEKFSGSVTSQLASTIKIKHGFVKSKIRNARFTGQFKGKLRDASSQSQALLGPLANATWHANLSSTLNRATKNIKAKGLILATYEDGSGRACMRLGYKNAKKRVKGRRNKGKSTLKVLGGEGAASTLAGTSRVKVTMKPKSGKTRLRGRVNADRGPATPLPRRCTKLRKKFGLAPIAG
ncbi:MAG TPA: hypothetical protein VD790_06795 [Thermoleophilaceae bacterium]|nr:hypothetical protein [Thermoleophilaceae bacterium]